MRPLIELKKDFEVISSLGDIVDVMKTASLIQFRTFLAKKRPNDVFQKEARLALAALGEFLEQAGERPLLFHDRKELPSLIIVVTSDEGFLGEMNTLLVNAGMDRCLSDSDEIVILGERGARYLEDVRKECTFFPGLTDNVPFSEAERVRDYMYSAYKRKFGRVIVIYPEFVTLSFQKVTIWQALPLQSKDFPTQGAGGVLVKDQIIEPTALRVLDGLVELWLGVKFLEIFWSSKQSEYAARIMSLEGSGQELTHWRGKLSFEYFHQVHSLREKVIREIFASRVIEKRR